MKHVLILTGLIGVNVSLEILLYVRNSIVSSGNLMSFHALTKNDPLFYDPNTDAPFLRASVQSLKDIEEELNNRPRKRLQYQTPTEVFNKYLQKGCNRS